MSIAGAYLRDFEPFANQPIEFKSQAFSNLANVHFFVGQNGTGKTRLLSLLASACGNPEELQFRTDAFYSTVVVTSGTNGVEKLRVFSEPNGSTVAVPGPISAVLEDFGKKPVSARMALARVSGAVAMAFRSIPSLEDHKIAPMAEVKWPDAKAFLRFAHHSNENAQLCQALANLKVRMGIVSSDPNDRAVRMIHAFDKAIRSITSSDLVLTIGYSGKDFRLKASWLGKELQLKQLPDGLRSIVGWLASVVCKLDALLPEIERPLEQPIILLLDEPDAHLHPAWQRKLIPAIQHLLPNAQIFVATHSPFVISSVNAGWIYIFEANSDGKVTIKPPIACSQGDSYVDVVEDVLGIKERFDPETEDLLRDFRSKRDAIKRQSSPESLHEVQVLADKIAKRGETLQFMMGREMAQTEGATAARYKVISRGRMRKFNRAAEPAMCTHHGGRWNAQWAELRRTNPIAAFIWYQVEGKSARDHMLPTLREQSQQHCSFCDAFPVDGVSNETIEHFRPKSRFPEHAYTWTNLYYCCDACQSKKREQWDDLLLHADAEDFRFSRYFEFDFTTGQIRPNALASPEDQQRAAVTVSLYGLDSPARRRNRLDEARRYANRRHGGLPQDLWAYRDFLDEV